MNLDILNVKSGHNTLSFNLKNKEEKNRAKEQINDMLKMGYAVFIEKKNGKTERIKKFDSKIGSYIIGDKEAIAIKDTDKVTAVAKTAGGCVTNYK